MANDRMIDDEPIYVISVAAKLVSLHPQTLRYYDRIGLLKPTRTSGRVRLYSQRDVDRLRKIVRITEDLGVNLAGVEVLLNMSHRMEKLQHELESTKQAAQAEITRLNQRIQEMEACQAQSYQVINVTVREVNVDQEETQDEAGS